MTSPINCLLLSGCEHIYLIVGLEVKVHLTWVFVDYEYMATLLLKSGKVGNIFWSCSKKKGPKLPKDCGSWAQP